MGRPIVTDESELGALGVRIVDALVHDKLRHLFRPRERRDLGIDGEIELVDERDEKRRGTGRLIAAQIKCGPSFFTEEDEDAYIFRGEPKHYEYWSDFSLPVLIIICHPDTREAYWTEFSHTAAETLKAGWKIRIPKRNLLRKAGYELQEVVRRGHRDNLVDLAVRAWVHARNAERVEFCGIFEMPRDYHWYQHLLMIGTEPVMLHWIYATYGRFETSEIQDVIRHLPMNEMYGSKLLLCLVAETAGAFQLPNEAAELIEGEKKVELIKLIYRRDWASVAELETDGILSVEYRDGEPVYRETLDGTWVS